jgi:uncharacterized protein (TIGR03067 family)
MRIRLIALAVVALTGMTAFAPAPFVRPDRKKDSNDTLDALQGTWSMTDKHRVGPAGQVQKYSTSQKVRVEKDTWRFASAFEGRVKAPKGGGGLGGGPAGGFGGRTAAYKIVLDRQRRPMEFRLKRTTTTQADYMVGIIQVRGDTVRMVYRLGTGRGLGGIVEEQTPRDFDKVPEGWYSMTLRRDSR